MSNQRYMMRGVSASKEDVHNAIKNIDKGIFPQAFCKIIPDILGGDPEYCNIMHADGAGTKSSLAYMYWKEAVELFRNSEPGEFDVILMDIMMPVMDGYEAAKMIRSLDREDAKEIPIIAMTANAFTEDRIKAKAAGMDEHVAKPVDVELLIKVIHKLVG